MNKNHRTKFSKKIVLISIIAAGAIAAVGYFGYRAYHKADQRSSSDESSGNNATANYAPPTEEEKQEVENNKDRIVAEKERAEDATPDVTTSDQTVTPIIGYVQQAANKNIEANGYIPGIIEDGGTCTLQLERQGVVTAVQKSAQPDAQGTICGLMTVERNKLSPGEWQVSLKYSSDTHNGVSRSVKVTVE